ncbi:hypothetical protein HMSSN036_12130 [Paenibacillus macerans]|nr:hypothetical protein HMSSN036_12130 [Paenibacillus macerans]
MKKVFYKPQDGWVGDVIPFYDHGEYKLYYLHDQRAGGDYGNHTTWNLITTKTAWISKITAWLCRTAAKPSRTATPIPVP